MTEASSAAEPAKERPGFSSPDTDAEFDGGVPAASSALVPGAPGGGQTPFGLGSWSSRGRGKRESPATFDKGPERLLAATLPVALDRRAGVEGAPVRCLWRPPLLPSPDA